VDTVFAQEQAAGDASLKKMFEEYKEARDAKQASGGGKPSREDERALLADLYRKNRRSFAEALVSAWMSDTKFNLTELGTKKLSAEEMVKADVEWAIFIASRRTGFQGVIDANWLFAPRASTVGNVKRKDVSLAALIQRFDPAAPVTDANAQAVAEEVVWTKAIGLSDGTLESLPAARRILQGLILEKMGFEIGDLTDADPDRRAMAEKRFDEAMNKYAETVKSVFETLKAEGKIKVP